jgi:LytS/YehU family sensor histidine kinase
LRYNLDASKKISIPLTQEIDSVEKYLFIQKERFGKRLEYKITGQSHCEVLPLLIQPLVENSIKHNLDHGESIEITISIVEDNKLLYITVIDSIAGLKSEMIGRGTGLELTRRRVKLSGGDLQVEKGGVQIYLPLR